MKPKIDVGNVVLCDFVGLGANNKHVLLNVFSGDVVVPVFPANLGFGLYIEILPAKIDGALGVVHLSVLLKDTQVISGQAQTNIVAGSPGVIVIPYFQIEVLEETTISVIISSDEYEDTMILSKKIMKSDSLK